MTLRDPARRLESGFRYEVLNPRGGRPRLSGQGFSSVSHFVDLLRSSNTSRIMHKRAWRLFDLSWNKTSPGDDGSFFLRAQVTYVSAAAAKGAHVYFFCARTRSLTAWNCCSETRRWTQRRGTCVISRRARRCCEEARYRRRPRGISDRCSRLIGRLCNATAPGASKRGCGSGTFDLERPYRSLRGNCTIPPSGVDR